MTEAPDSIEKVRPQRWPRYPEYKDSGVEWLGDIPAHWSALPIKRVSRLCYGESLSADDRANGDVVVFGSNGPVGTHDKANTRAPCVIVGRKGSFGKVNYSADAAFAIDTTFVADARFTKGNLRWLYYTLQCARLDTISKDSAIPGLAREDAYARAIAVGPLDEQHAIAAFLDRETAKIDGLVERQKRLIELLQEKRAALITRAVTRGLDPNVPMKDSGIEWLGEIPDHWKVRRWRHCCRVVVGQVAPDDQQFRERVLIAPNHIESGTGRILYMETANQQGAISGKYLVGPGDIIYSKIRPALNKVCISAGNWLCSADMYPISITESRLQTGFLLYFMLSKPFVRLMAEESMRVAMPKVNRDKLAACPLLIPDPAEQLALSGFLDCETAKVDALIAKVCQAIDLLKEFRTALISAAVTGKIDVRAASATGTAG